MTWPVQRRFPRVPVSVPVEARHLLENFPRRGQTTIVSEGGCYIEMVQTLEPPAGIDVVLWLNDKKIRARAEVVTRHPNLGNGIRFIRMPEEDKTKLREYLDSAQRTRGLPFRRIQPERIG
jgi:hypothetical protein